MTDVILAACLSQPKNNHLEFPDGDVATIPCSWEAEDADPGAMGPHAFNDTATCTVEVAGNRSDLWRGLDALLV